MLPKSYCVCGIFGCGESNSAGFNALRRLDYAKFGVQNFLHAPRQSPEWVNLEAPVKNLIGGSQLFGFSSPRLGDSEILS